MPRLAIIIPFEGNTKALEDTLISVLENRPDDSEVLVVLDQPYEDPYALGDEVEFVAAPSRPGLIAGMNLGIERSRAPIVHLVTCGTLVAEGWADAAMRHFDDPQVVAVAPVVVDARNPERILAAGMAYGAGGDVRAIRPNPTARRQEILATRVLAPHLSAAFYRRSALELAGRFAVEVPDPLAWLDMGLVFRQIGARTVLEPGCRVAAAPAEPARRTRFRTAFEAERFFWRWAGVHGWVRSLALHGLLVLGEFVCGLTRITLASQLAGRIVGGFRGILARRGDGQRRRLAELAEAWTARPRPTTNRPRRGVRPARPPMTRSPAAASLRLPSR